MHADLSFPGEVIGCPIVREEDGLALSSRNIFIENRSRALTIWAALQTVARAVDEGERSGGVLVEAATRELKLDSVDYVTLASQLDAGPLDHLDRPAFLAIAGRVGDVRLIDNLPIDLVGEMFVPDEGIRLERPSMLAER